MLGSCGVWGGEGGGGGAEPYHLTRHTILQQYRLKYHIPSLDKCLQTFVLRQILKHRQHSCPEHE